MLHRHRGSELAAPLVELEHAQFVPLRPEIHERPAAAAPHDGRAVQVVEPEPEQTRLVLLLACLKGLTRGHPRIAVEQVENSVLARPDHHPRSREQYGA